MMQKKIQAGSGSESVVCLDLSGTHAPADPFERGTQGLWVTDIRQGDREDSILEHLFEHCPPDAHVALTLSGRIDNGEHLLSRLGAWAENGLKLICWDCPTPPDSTFQSLLWQIARLGIWNHVMEGFAPETAHAWQRFVAENPYIVHSHGEFPAQTSPGRSAYGETRTLPGIPLWKKLGSIPAILTELAQAPAKTLAAGSWNPHTEETLELGADIQFNYSSPAELPPGYLDEICRMVAAGGSVDLTHVRANLERAHCIAYAVENGVIVGNSSLKHPRSAFFDYLKEVTGLDFEGFVERGYTSVRPEYRAFGVGKRLLQGLTERAGEFKVFSLIDETNVATQKIALRNQTVKLLVYTSERSGKAMGLWMPEVMLETMDARWQADLAAYRETKGETS